MEGDDRHPRRRVGGATQVCLSRRRYRPNEENLHVRRHAHSNSRNRSPLVAEGELPPHRSQGARLIQ